MSYEKGERKEKGHLKGITRIFTHESLKDKNSRVDANVFDA